jgi:hypothetical protein
MSKRWLGLLFLGVWIGGSEVAHAAFSATPVAIGTVTVAQSQTGTTTLSNSPGTVTVGTFDLSAAGCSEFQVTTPTPLVVGSGGSAQTVTVQLTPTTAGAKSCTITVKDNTTPTPNVLGTFTATGTAVAPQTISVNPVSANFGNARVNNAALTTTIAAQVFTVSNTGGTSTTLNVSNITFSDPDYSLATGSTSSFAVAQGTTKTFTVQFDPSTAGTHDATMTIASDDPVTPMKTVSLTGVGTTALIAVSDVNFGIVNDTTTSNQNISVTNTGANPRGVLTAVSATITDTGGGNFFSFGTGSGCNGGTSCTFTANSITTGTFSVPVQCHPPAAAATTDTATVTFVSDSDAGGDTIAQLTCTGGRPNIVVSTNMLNFGNVAVGSTSTAQTVTIQNTGNATLTYSLTKNPNVSQYAITGCTTNCSIAANSMATFSVTFAPTAIGFLGTRIDITNNDPDLGDNVFSVNVSGTGTAPQISVSPITLTFANTEVGRTSTAQTVTATNTGNSSLTISGATFQAGGGDYIVINGNTGSQTIAPNATASWDIACKPSVLGARPGTFRIASNSLSGAPTDVTLSCTGEQGIITVIPTSLDFGPVAAGTTKPLTFTLKNNGNVAINGITSVLNPTTIGYQFNTGAVPTTLAAGASATLTVTFAPQSGNDGGPATITFNAGWGNFGSTTMAVLMLNGDGLNAGFDISPAMLDFGNFRFDTRPQLVYHIINTGQANMQILNQMFTPDTGTASTEFGFVIRKAGVVVTLPQTLSMGQQLDVTVTAQPNSRIGLLSGHVDIHSDLTATPTVMPDRQLTLTGTATTAAISVPAVVDFGGVDVDGPAQTKTIMLANTGVATLDVTSITKMIGASAAFTVTLPSGATQVAPGNSLSLTITYKPTVERPPNQFDNAVLVANLAGIFGGPTQAMITIQGRGIDRHLLLDAVDASFPATQINPGDAAPTRTITVHNTGEATLSITALMLSGDPVWQLVDEAPVDIPGGESHDFLVRFVPTAIDAYTGELTLINNDDGKPMAVVTLTGEGVFVDAHGSGGCDVGGHGAGSGSAFVLGVLAACWSLRRRRRAGLAVAGTALVALVAIAPVVRADGIGIAVFEPTPATTGTGFQLQSPEVGADGSWGASAIMSFASKPLVLDTTSTTEVTHDSLVERSSLLQLGGAYAFLGRFEAGAHFPLYMQSGQVQAGSKGANSPASGTARGNLKLHGKVRLWQGEGGFGTFTAGASAIVVLPTASKDQFTGSDKLEGRLLLLGSFTPAVLRSRLAFSANAGPVVRGESEVAKEVATIAIVQKSGVAWGVGTSYRFLDELWGTAEVFGEATSEKREQASTSAMPSATVLSRIEWLAGVSYKMNPQFTVGLAVGRGLTNAIGTPAVRGVLSLAYVPGAAAIAPIPAPPPEADSDGDGIVDSDDKCPNEPEDKDGFEDTDGCPDPDNDHDGIPDALDKCPIEPEDKDGFRDQDGCPDKDNDDDGIPDALDKCPNDPEDKDGFQDADGCPDLDNDRDGIPDAKDKCPNEPETINGIQDDDGCPDKGDSAIILSPDRIETLDPIQFNGVKLTKASLTLLEQVGATLRAHSEIVRLRITVHVQPTADSDADQTRSEKRAQAVREWLVQWGIAPARLEARGFGGDKPLVPPDQRGAAKINERIELIILERK